MSGYYAKRLAGRRLQRCYELAPARVRRYLEAELLHALARIQAEDRVLELGCGYGRIARRLAEVAREVVGIDTSAESLELGRRLAGSTTRCEFMQMDARALQFPQDSFDGVLCLQNGICAFGVDPAAVLKEALRVTRAGGRVLLSSYAARFWPHRLAWFEAQAAAGLIGAIDPAASRDGVIVCKDGLRLSSMTPEGFRALAVPLGVEPEIFEVDGSSLFCEITKPGGSADRT